MQTQCLLASGTAPTPTSVVDKSPLQTGHVSPNKKGEGLWMPFALVLRLPDTTRFFLILHPADGSNRNLIHNLDQLLQECLLF